MVGFLFQNPTACTQSGRELHLRRHDQGINVQQMHVVGIQQQCCFGLFFGQGIIFLAVQLGDVFSVHCGFRK